VGKGARYRKYFLVLYRYFGDIEELKSYCCGRGFVVWN
jgi:hypothetical protein